jgi:hypothetical protein
MLFIGAGADWAAVRPWKSPSIGWWVRKTRPDSEEERNTARTVISITQEKGTMSGHVDKNDQKKKTKTKKELDEELDRGLRESFPGSDPVSVTQPAPAKPAKDKAGRH